MADQTQNSARSKLLAIGLLTPVALIAALGFIAYHLATQSVESFNWVTHMYQVMDEIDGALAGLVEVETAGRGFTITGRETYLDSYTNTLTKIAYHLDNLRELVSDNPIQQTNVVELAALAEKKLERAKLTIGARQREGFEAAQQAMAGDPGKILMDKIRQVVTRMKAEEFDVLHVREERYRVGATRVQYCALSFVAADLAVLLVVVFLLVRVQRLQELISTSAWAKQVDRGQEGTSFELYLKDRLGKKDDPGVSPETVRQITRELEAWAKKKDGRG